jgi:hypothetical protein
MTRWTTRRFLTFWKKRKTKEEIIMGIDVYDFCMLACDDGAPCAIYDMTTEEEVFNGDFRDCMESDYCDCTVMSFDVENGKDILNIETGDEED